MADLINITAPQYRCSIGGCPAVYKSEDGKTFTIIGARVVSQIADKAGPGEEAVEISADLLLSSLGIADLIEAAELVDQQLQDGGVTEHAHTRLAEALSSIKGGK